MVNPIHQKNNFFGKTKENPPLFYFFQIAKQNLDGQRLGLMCQAPRFMCK